MRLLAPKDKRIAIDQQRLKQADLQFSSQTRLRFNLIVSYLLAATFVFLPAIPPVVGRARSTGMRHVPLAFSSQPAEQRLVLIGGGHAHVQVIKALNHASRPKHLKVTLIDVQRSATYSGMVPGTIAGVYTQEETLLDLEALAQWAKIDFLHSRVVDIDVDNKEVYLEPANTSSGEGIPSESIPSISFDAISIDIGSNSRGFHQAKGAASYAIPTRPIADLVNRLDVVSTTLQQRQKQFFPPTSNQETTQVVVIGGGTAGLELSMSIRGRWNPLIQDREDPTNGESPLKVTVLDSGNELLPGESAINRQVFRSILDERGIIVRHGCEVGAVHCDYVELTGGERVPFHHCIWATGAGAHDLAYRLGERGLAVSSRGWIEVNPHLQSITHPHVFAAGDCCTIEGLKNGQPSPPKAGVFAVSLQHILPVILCGRFTYPLPVQFSAHVTGTVRTCPNRKLDQVLTCDRDHRKFQRCGTGDLHAPRGFLEADRLWGRNGIRFSIRHTNLWEMGFRPKAHNRYELHGPFPQGTPSGSRGGRLL